MLSTCRLDQLRFETLGNMPSAMQHALSNVQSSRCLLSCFDSCQLEVLPRAQHLALCMHNGTVSWFLLAGSARCFAWPDQSRPIVVAGCTGSTPEHAQPWAIFLCALNFVQGLPQHRFVRLQTGWWAWRNKAAIVQGLVEPALCALAPWRLLT